MTRLCKICDVSSSGYYDWLKRGMSIRDQRNKSLLEKMKLIFSTSKGTYGVRRIKTSLKQEYNIVAACSRISRLMKIGCLSAKQIKKFVITTDSKHNEYIWFCRICKIRFFYFLYFIEIAGFFYKLGSRNHQVDKIVVRRLSFFLSNNLSFLYHSYRFNSC